MSGNTTGKCYRVKTDQYSIPTVHKLEFKYFGVFTVDLSETKTIICLCKITPELKTLELHGYRDQ